jgi:hypothetical protein
MAIALTFAPQAGTRCVGSAESQVRWRMTRPMTLYVFVFRYGGRPGTSLSPDRVGERYNAVPLVGEATTSRTVEQQLSGSFDAADQATVSGTYTDHLAITLKRLPLRR